MDHLGDFLDGIDNPQYIGYMGQGNKTGPGTEQVLQTGHIQLPIFQVNIVQFGSCFSAGLLPRNDIGMVFQDGNDDLITWLE